MLLGSDKSRGYCLEMICADFLAGAHASGGDPNVLLEAVIRAFRLLSSEQQAELLERIRPAEHAAAWKNFCPNSPRIIPEHVRLQVLRRDRWHCQICGCMRDL